MPYVPDYMRDPVVKQLDPLIVLLRRRRKTGKENVDGLLNFAISRLLVGVLELDSAPRYSSFVTAEGTLTCVGLELYRRFAHNYEDTKLKENGDILHPPISGEED